MNRILLCVDGSEYSITAAEYAAQLAAKVGATVEALHVIDTRVMEGPVLADLGGALGAQPYLALLPQFQAIQMEKSERIMEHLADHFASGPKFEYTVLNGNLVPCVLQREAEADLVVMGKRGEHAKYETDVDVLGPSVEWIVRRSTKPCLVTPWVFRPVERVLAAYDGSAHASKALEIAIKLVREEELALSIAVVAPGDEEEEVWRRVLDDGVAAAAAAGIKAMPYLLKGHADAAILEFCRKAEYDLLCMGAYGHSRIREFLLGSTTFNLLLRSSIPVLLAR